MIISYKELINNGFNAKQIKKMVSDNFIYKIEKGLYSYEKKYNQLEYISKKYPDAIFTSESAFFYLGLTDYIPEQFNLATSHGARVISNKTVRQIYVIDKLLDVGKINIKYNDAIITVYDQERMLIELVKKKNQIPFDYYKEIINNYRKILEKIDIKKLEEYLTNFNNGNKLLEIINNEVF